MEKLSMRKKPLQGNPSSMKRIHYSKRRFTITQKSFPKLHNQQLIGKTFRWTRTSRIAFTDDAPMIMTRTFNQIQEPLAGFFFIAYMVGNYGFSFFTNKSSNLFELSGMVNLRVTCLHNPIAQAWLISSKTISWVDLQCPFHIPTSRARSGLKTDKLLGLCRC